MIQQTICLNLPHWPSVAARLKSARCHSIRHRIHSEHQSHLSSTSPHAHSPAQTSGANVQSATLTAYIRNIPRLLVRFQATATASSSSACLTRATATSNSLIRNKNEYFRQLFIALITTKTRDCSKATTRAGRGQAITAECYQRQIKAHGIYFPRRR